MKQSLVPDGTKDAPGLAWDDETNLGIYRAQNGQITATGRLGVGRRWVPNGDPSNVVLYIGNRGIAWDTPGEADGWDVRASSANLYSFASEASMKCDGGDNVGHFSAWFQAFSYDDGLNRKLKNQYGVYVAVNKKHGTLAIENSYGIYVEAQKTGDKLNYGIFNAGTLRQQGATLFDSVTVGNNAAQSGHVRLPNAGRLMARTKAGSDRALVECDANNVVYLGDSGGWTGIQVYPGSGHFSVMTGSLGLGTDDLRDSQHAIAMRAGAPPTTGGSSTGYLFVDADGSLKYQFANGSVRVIAEA